MDTNEPKKNARDPRSHVTPDAFAVAEGLLGRPLARPWQRGVALLVDLVLIFALTKTGSWAFATVAALVVLWLTLRGAKGWASAFLRGTVALPTALVVFLLLLVMTWDGPTYGPTVSEWQQFGEDINSDDPLVREAATEEIGYQFEQHFSAVGEQLAQIEGVEDNEGVEIALGLAGAADNATGQLDAERLAELPPEEASAAADAVDAFSAALRERNAEAMEESRGEAVRWIAGDELERRDEARSELVRGYGKVVRENQELRSRLDNPSFRYLLRGLAGDLGLSVGWSGLYFTLVLALWRGRTPGKFLLGLRVVRLDQSRITVWTSFERFAGYAAGLATGLLGFLQIFWDANRQAVQDKVVGTVVIVDR